MNPYTTNGAIAWQELQTSNQRGAADFYASIFGWELQEMPMPGIGSYITGSVGKVPHAGIMQRVSEEMPPVWILYVTVDSVDAIATRVPGLGGDVFAPPMSVPQVGRFCGIADPQGAMIFAMEWEQTEGPPQDFGQSFVTPGKFSWFQLQTPDVEGAVGFYTQLFGWSTEVNNMGMGPYTITKIGDVAFGGIIPPMGEVPAHWGAYVTVQDADATAAKVTAHGGTVMGEPFDIPTVGRAVTFQDPQGAWLIAIAYEMPSE